MSVLVLKKWSVDAKPVDPSGNFVVIVGRQSGLISWLLSLRGLDPVTTLKVSAVRVDFRESSLSGVERRVIPLQSLSSVDYGYRKPWKRAIALFVAGLALEAYVTMALLAARVVSPTFLSGGVSLGIMMVLLAFAVLYYVFNKTIYFRFVENSGLGNGIRFKRSIIENVAVDERHAGEACELLLSLIEQARLDENLVAIRYGVEGLAAKMAAESDGEAALNSVVSREPAQPAQIDVDLRSIEFSCPECGKFFEGPSTLVGSSYTCPECHVSFHIH